MSWNTSLWALRRFRWARQTSRTRTHASGSSLMWRSCVLLRTSSVSETYVAHSTQKAIELMRGPIISPARQKLILALDFGRLNEALDMARSLAGLVGMFKINIHLFTAEGPEAVRKIGALGPGIFLGCPPARFLHSQRKAELWQAASFAAVKQTRPRPRASFPS